MVDNSAAFFNYTPVGRASDSMMAPDLKLFILVGWDRSFLYAAWPTGVQLVFFFCSGFQLFGAQGSSSSGSLLNLLSPRLCTIRMSSVIYLFVLDDSLTS